MGLRIHCFGDYSCEYCPLISTIERNIGLLKAAKEHGHNELPHLTNEPHTYGTSYLFQLSLPQ